MKASIITPVNIRYSYTAMEMNMYEYAKFLHEKGIDMTLLVPDLTKGKEFLRKDHKEVDAYYKSVPKKSIRTATIRLPFNYTPNFYKDLPQDSIVYFPAGIYEYVPNIITKTTGQKYIIGCHSMYVRDGRITDHPFIEAVMTSVLSLKLKSRDGRANIFYHAINPKQVDYLRSLGIATDRIFHIPNWVDTKKYRLGRSKGKKLNVVHIGGKGKNSRLVIRIIEELMASGRIKDFQFYFIGRVQPEELSKYAKKIPNVSDLGPILDDEKVEVLSNSDVLIVSNRDECFSVVILEAMASGLRVIVEKENPIIDQLIKDGAAAYKASKDAPSTYTKILLELAKEKQNKNFDKKGRSNRDIVAKKFDKKIVLAAIKDMFVQVGKSDS